MKRLFTFFLIMSATDIFPGDRPVGKPFATRSEIVAQHGIAATSQPLATQVALRWAAGRAWGFVLILVSENA